MIPVDTLILPDLLAISTILAEAGNQPFNGMVAVGEVIRERTRRKYNSDGSLIGTLLLPWQFSCWNQDPINRRLMIRSLMLISLSATIPQGSINNAIAAWEASKTSNVSNKAVLYHTVNIGPSWIKSPKVIKTVQIGDHLFYNEVK